ncbi:MAG: cytochrome c3 family protein [Sulfurimonas sp.]|jgi:hypothetical protein
MISNKIKLMIAASIFGASTAFAGAWSLTGTISGSPHDLSAMQGTDDNGEVCVYCHTPHAANTAFTGAPLWNKSAAALSVYTMYGATATNTAGTTIAGTATDATPASPSLACLSCHDGASAIDSIVNAPGSGMGELAAGTTDIASLTTTYGGNIGGTVVDDGATTTGSTTTSTTTGNVNLSNDHPVSITYTAGTASLVATTTALTDWVGATTVANLLRSGKVECGSCHDPHNGYATQGTDVEVNFLRKTNAASALCLGCHAK